jgi:hypothetical protein
MEETFLETYTPIVGLNLRRHLLRAGTKKMPR